ncbi:MAG: NAD(P)H-hydrate dehydratase [Myxococcales bacterium]|nr:NAD(P)H-hydrate dehydratase [Myxococcales bacterium]
MKVVTAAEMRALDRQAIETIGVPGVVLMESAGRAVADLVAGLVQPLAGARVVVVAGSGNNGGDGFVVARHLKNRGAEVAVVLVAAPGKVEGDARVHLEAARRSGVPIHDGLAGPEFAAAAALVDGAELVVDALLGTGATRPVEGHLAVVVARINASRGLRVAIDLPSGLDADRGHPLGICVAAHHTVTFAFPKLGLVTSPGFLHAGALHVADIGIPPSLAGSLRRVLLDEGCLAELRRPRDPSSHKGTHGHALIIAGSLGHVGAALLAGEGCARAGAGLVTIASPDEAHAALAAQAVEGMTSPFGPEPVDPVEAWKALEPLLHGKRAIAFGPGVPRTPGMRAILERLLAAWAGPLVVDADGLNLLAEDLAPLGHTAAKVVLTPHPAEMGRLAGIPTAEVQADRVAVAEAFAAHHGAVVVLKGARTLIAAPDGRTAVNPTGNPGMATGGTGDVLTGVVCALLAGGCAPFEAACAGVYLHGRAGDLARDARGEVGLLARDLVAELPRARRG